VEDETNEDACFRRNAVRHRVLPAIRDEFGPAVTGALARHADVAREDDTFLGSLVRPLVGELVRTDESNIAVDRERLSALPPSLGRRVAMDALRMAGVREPGFEHAMKVLALARGEVSAVQFPGGISGKRTAGIVRLSAVDDTSTPCGFRYALRVPGTVWVPEAGRVVGAEPTADTSAALRRLAASSSSTAVIRADGVGPELFVRSWMSGDALRPLGLGGRKKLQDLFVDRKVPRGERPRLPLVVDGEDRILWVPGHAVDEACRVTSDTRAVVVLTVSEPGGRE
jgi:tRNA(Ile)-lysidine synthase